MEIKLINFGGKAPTRVHYNDAGADVYTSADAVLPPQTITKVPLGIGLEMPDGYVAFIFPRSGMSANNKLTTEIVPIDSGYRGEIHAIIFNANSHEVHLGAGTKIAQLVFFPIALPKFTFEMGEQRNDSAFGSSGDK
jgi:dUTP pyrophosphatase